MIAFTTSQLRRWAPKAGATGPLEWTFTEPATLQLACHTRDHYTMGMVISITVVA